MHWRKPPRSRRRTMPAPESFSVSPPPPWAPSFLPRDRHCPDLCGTCFLLHLFNTRFYLSLNLIELHSYIVYYFTFGCLHAVLSMLFITLTLKTSETSGKLLSFLYRERKCISMSGVVVWAVCAKPDFCSASCLSLMLSHPSSC